MYTIVVVDDEEELRKAIINRIDWEAVGFLVVGEADNGIEALDLVEKKEPDLLLTDIRMPFLSGLELARQVREIRPATQIAFLSGYDEFAYAQQAIQYNIISYLLKPLTMADLTRELLAIKEKLDHLFEEFHAKQAEHTSLSDFMVPLLLDNYQPAYSQEREDRLLSQAAACGFIRNLKFLPQYAAMTILIRDGEGKNLTSPEHVRSLDNIARKYVNSFTFYTNGRVVCLLSATRSGFEKYLHILVGDIVQSVERILQLQALIGVSRITEYLSGCHEAYKEAMDAMSYSAENDSGVHYIADEERASQLDMERVLRLIDGVEGLLRGGEEKELTDYLARMFETLRVEGASQSSVRFLLIQLFSSVYQTVCAVADAEESKGLQESVYMQKVTAFDGSILEARDQATKFCLAARELISFQRRKSGEILCEQALRIIGSEFSDPDLSLVSVSGRINVSPNYLSSLIKKYEKKTFIDLLTERRMEEAKQLILCTPMKIREISEKCGYSDQHYFSYCFKKYTGVSPNGLRQKNQSGEVS